MSGGSRCWRFSRRSRSRRTRRSGSRTRAPAARNSGQQNGARTMAKRIAAEGEAPPERSERRFVYNGDTQRPEFTPPRGNRPVKRRKRSTFLIIGGLLVVSLLIVL